MWIVDRLLAQLANTDEHRYRKRFHFPYSDRLTNGRLLLL
jgi:hypothetical protein